MIKPNFDGSIDEKYLIDYCKKFIELKGI